MASSYYAKKKEESDKKIAEALEARRNRTSASSQASAGKASTDDPYAAKKDAYDKRLQAALDARSERIQSELPSILSDIQNSFNREVDSYNKAKKPAFGSFESTYDSQRDSRINISKLRDRVEAYRGYFDEGVADQLLSSLDQMKSGYDSHLTYSRFASQEEYDTAKYRAGWQQKYQGKTYDDLQRTISGMKDGDEKKWLLEFADSVMTRDDYDRVIADESRELEPLKKLMEEAGKIQRAAWSGNPADANRQNKNSRLQALAKRYGYSSYEEAKTRYDELQKSHYEHTNASKYKFLNESQDYDGLSKQVAEDPTAGFGIGFGDKWWGKGDPKYDYINDIDGTRQSYYGRFASGGGSPYAIYDQMTEEEIASYNYLYNAEGEQAANDYLEYLEYTLNERMQGTAAANAKMLAEEYPVFASAVSVPINLMSGIGAVDVAWQNLARGLSGEYKPIDYNASAMAPTVISSTIRGTVSQNITNATGQIELDEEEHPVLSRILNGKSLGDVYQLGMSMADSAAIAAMAPAIGSAGTALLGGSAASQGILDAVAAGANDEQAIVMGVMNGAFEMLFEKVSLDNLLNGKSRNILTAMFKQGFIEGTEEFNTTLANTLADILVMAEKSSYKSSIAEYEAQGLSTEDATKRALLDVAIQIGWDFVGGMASGSIMGGGSYPIQNYQYANAEGNRIYGEDPGALIGEALEINPESKLANKLNDRLTDGRKVSGAQLYKLAEENETTMYSQDVTAIQKAAEARLSALGETGDVEAISAALAKQAAGKKLTKSERATLAGSRYAQRVANELNPANIESGGYASGWTAEIGTNRINADEYNRIVEAANLPQDGGNVAEDKLDPKPQNVATTQNLQADEGVMDVSPVTTAEEAAPVAAAEPVTQAEPLEETEVEEENPITLEDASKKYGAQAGAMVHTYAAGQDVAKYDAAYQAAYDMGMSGVSLSYAKESESTSYLSETQRELAYEAGVAAADSSAKAQAAKNQAKINGKTGRRAGTVQGKDVTIADLKQTFNDPQGKAYRYLTTVAEATGIDIVLYKSEANEAGEFEGAQGKFTWSEDKIYIDVNAGLVKAKDVNELSKYAMLRTFAHEFTHFIEKWNPVQYNELRKVVFDTLTERGENVHDLIERKRAQASGMTYDMASREVVAEAMTDILPDANFVQELAEKHKTIFQKLLEKLKEFVDNLRDYFNTLAKNPAREANALKEEVGESVKYLESIVKLFDNVAVEAVEDYQKTVAVEEAKAEAPVETKAETSLDEEAALMAYKSGGSYLINAKLREKIELTPMEQKLVDDLDSALRKLPVYNGTVYRNLIFDGMGDQEARDKFVALHVAGEISRNLAYTSTSTRVDGYPVEGEFIAHMVIESVSGKNIEGYGNNFESEVLFPRNTYFRTTKIEYAEDGTPTIYQKEVEHGRKGNQETLAGDPGRKPVRETGAAATDKMREMQEQSAGSSDLSPVSGWDPGQHPGRKGNLSEVSGEVTPTSVTDEHGFTITDNVERGSLEISFDSKPSDKVRDVLKEKKFRWNKTKKVWYGFADRADITEALRAAYEAENQAAGQAEEAEPEPVAEAAPEVQPVAEEKPQEPAPEGVGEYADIYDRLRNPLSSLPRFWTSGFLFRVYKVNGKWEGHVDAAEQRDGYEIANARGLKYTSELYEERNDAVEDIIAVARNNRLLDPVGVDTTQKTEEVKNNGNEEETGTILPHRGDGQGTARLLGEVEAEDVQGDGAERNPVADAGERGDQAGRHDLGTDAGTRNERGHGEGSSQGGDLRRDDGVTSEEPAPEHAEQLHEEVVEQVEQQSTEQPKGKNFVIGDSLNLPNGEKARYKANVDAIRLVKQLEEENRYATPAEQEILAKYVGWGGLANAFDQRKADWKNEYAELKELLTDEEYSLARGSTLNAHYTDISVIKAMYDGLAGLGFDGGRLMEPSAGVGNFVGAMPPAMSAKVKSWTMVELDSITGKIAKYLYPNADVRIQGFEKANIPNNFMDVAISNVPFGNYAIADKSYPKKVTSAIHNYFFAKALDKVRPGGIVMFITSSYTMNSRDNTVRKYIMQRADLLGAIRLPDTAFKGNAGTEVVTDILVLKKRAANTEYAGEDFQEAPWTRPVQNNYNGAYINTYFENHPEMVLGTPSMEGSMYRGESLTYKAFTDRGSLADQIREAFTHITGKMDYPAQKSPEKTNFAVEREGKKVKKNGLVVKDGKVYQNSEDGMTEVKVAKGVAERISGMLEIRDAAKELMNAQQQGLKDSEIKKARAKLNKLYDAFVQKHGFINSQVNRNAMKDDPDKYSIFALENYNPETKKGTKADIFSKNTIAPNRTVTSAKDVTEGLIVSVNQTGGVDTALIAKLTGMTEEAVTRELLDSRQAFKNRDGALEPAEVYLSGNVRAKLRDAEALAPIDADYQKNVEALRAVVPADVPYQDIFVNPGTPWIPNSVYSDFAAYMLGGRNTEWRTAVEVTRNPETGNFTVELKERYLRTNAANTQKWGTARRSFLELFDAMLNSRSVVIKNKLDDGTTVVDKDATAAANEKIENIQKEFQEWLWKDEARRNDLVYLYNETFNAIVTPKYNGDNLTVNGANAMKPLRPHQRNAVQRVISSGGNTLLAHKVGAGKTYEMAAAAMKLKELGLVRKPMFAVPKSLVAQWGTEFMDFFPTAKLLVAEASDFTAANRKVFMNRIANGEYDAVIVSYEQFERLPISNDFARELYQEQIDSIILAIEEAKAEKGGKSLSVKDLEKKRKSLQTKIDKLTDSAKDEDNISFEQLGVDSLFIDEAHNFKNLFYTTSMTNVAGLGNKDGSKRAFDLYTKVRYLQKLNGGRGIVFATATPVMNSMSEMYIMQKYLQPDLLEQLGLNTFDAWAKQFGEVVNGVEIKPSGQGYRVKQSFSRFKNMSELQLLFRNFADVLTDIPGLKIPKMKGGKVNVVVCEPGAFQQDYMKELEKRADNVKNVDPSVDNMLKITSDGRKISYTQRMIDPTLPYEEGCKIYRCAENVARVYEEDKANKGTQLIFCDMATPKGKSNTAATEAEETETDMESAKLYDDIKARLIEKGIPAKEIAFIHDADTDAKKKKLFADVNDGKVRVLIGSTGKMGVGMNAQKRVAAIHHLDAPWRPGDVEQRNGRAFRQGNIHDEVECFTYVTEGSFDARLWDILERKQNFINQVMNGENVGRETEDTGEVTLSAAEVKALASGSPLIMEQVQLDTDIKKLESLYRAHNSAVASAKLRLESDKGTIANLEKRIANGKIDLKNRVDTYSEGKFSMTIGKQKYTEKKDAGTALMAAAAGNATEEGYTTIGKFAGFELQVVKTYEGIKGRVAGAQGYSFNTYPGNTTHMITRLISVVEGIDETMEQWEKNLVATRTDMAEQEKLIAAPFAKQAELDQKRARYNEVMAILNPKEEQALGTMDDDTVQEQSRGYLEEREPAPVFYSQMAKVVEGVKIGKLEASSVVNMLRGKGVKVEEIKWSGIETWLEGKKSVTKAELQEFIAGSMLKIEEQMSGTATFIADDGNTYKSEADFKDAAYAIADARGIDRSRVKFVIDTEYDMDAYAYVGGWNNTILTAEVSNVEGTSPRFSQYKLDGGTNYREILFTMPDNSYSNRAMRTHWGDDAEGVLAHARIQDFTADGGKMLFVEEIQSDYHNEGHQSGYADSKMDAEIARLQAEADKRFFALEDYSTEVTGLAGEWETVEKTVKGSRLLLEYLEAKDAYDKAMNDYVKRVPDAPFRDSYHEYVLKRLIRMAAEQGYDSIGWTTAQMQSDRWSEEYAEGYRIEYDQDIPKFLNKYGKKWGAKVGKTTLNGETVWTMPITDTMKESVLYEGQAQYQERTNTLTDREVLALAAEQVKVDNLTDAERDALNIFQKRLEKLTDLEEQRAEQGRLYKEQQFGAKPDRAAAAETLDRMHVLDAQIKRASADVLTVEEKTVLRNVLKKARKVVENQQWAHDQEILRRWRDRRANAEAVKKYRDRVRRDVDELTKWVLHPSNKDVVKHIPDALKDSVIPFLSSINFMSKQSLKGGNATVADKAFQKQLKSLKAALRQNIDTYGLYSGYNDLPPNFMDRLQTFIDSVDAIVEKNSGEFVINQMTSDELRELSKVVRTLKDYIQQFNRFHVNAMFQHVYEAGDDTIHTLGLMKNASDKTGTLSNFVLWQQMRPAYAFERFGDGGKAIYDGLREGQAKLAFNTKTIVDFSKKAYTAKEVNAWEQEIKTIRLGGDIVKMRVSQIMSLYELSKRKQALGHILKGGIRVATFKNGKHKISDVGHVITQGDLQTIIDTLTPRQKEVADKLQKFMAEQGGTWGNYVSVKRFGEEMFGEKEYFPINSDGRHLQSNADEAPGAANLYALLNMSFTKELTENASNRIILYSIFDVFSNHMASMAQYNAFALPVLDALKWFNYQMKSDPDENGKRFVLGSVRDQMARVYGTPEESRPGSGKKGYAEIFVENILKAFNGTEAQGTSYDSIGMRSLHAYNRAQVAYNFRVVVQQPLAITRAAQIIDFRSIVQGTKLSPVATKKNIEEMRKYSGIAAWKALGFYDVNISRGLNAIIKHSDTATDMVIEVGMKGAEAADTLTWAGIWSACKAEVMRKQKLKPKDEGFYEAVTKLFEDVIYKTQVVDSVLTKNEFMRDKGFFARLIGSFMSEPTATASMLVDAVDKYNRAIQGGMTRQRAWQKNGKQIARTIYVYSVGAVMLAAVQAAADALRDDDDYQTFMEKWLEAFGGNAVDELMPLNKLPIVSDFYEAAKEIVATWTGWDIYGNPPQSVFMQWYDSLVKGGEILHDRIMGEDTNYTWYGGIYKLLQALSGMTGLPMAAATREAITAWNNTVGAMAPSLKVKTYEPSEKAQIKYAYEDGYLTAEEATQELLEKALVDTEDEAYWTIQGWEAGEGYSRYDAIMDAVLNGTGFDDAMDELTSHGYTEREVLSQAKSGIGEMYRDGQITKQQATRMLEKHLDMTDDEITEVVNKWSCQVVTGIPYDDIKQEFLDGNITASRAIDMRVRYGGYTREEAAETVTEWRAEKETGIAYDEIDEAFNAGEISQAEARDMYVTYGGKTAEEAEEKVAVLAFVKEHPDCKGISYAAVDDYTTYCEADGVPAGTFYDAWKYNSNTHADVDANGESISGSKKIKVLVYIDSLALTSAQKDSLYYAFGWAQSKIYEAPWH